MGHDWSVLDASEMVVVVSVILEGESQGAQSVGERV